MNLATGNALESFPDSENLCHSFCEPRENVSVPLQRQRETLRKKFYDCTGYIYITAASSES